MTDLQLLLTYCWDHPKDRAAARGLCDEYMSVHGVTFMCAARETYRLRRNQRNRDELAAATKAIARGTKWAPLLRLHIRNAAGPEQALSATIIIVAGRRRPEFIPANPTEQSAFGLSHVIRVGARWVIDRAEVIVSDMSDGEDSEPMMHPIDFFQ